MISIEPGMLETQCPQSQGFGHKPTKGEHTSADRARPVSRAAPTPPALLGARGRACGPAGPACLGGPNAAPSSETQVSDMFQPSQPSANPPIHCTFISSHTSHTKNSGNYEHAALCFHNPVSAHRIHSFTSLRLSP